MRKRAVLDLLSVLVTDGYLAECQDRGEGRYHFQSGLLRRYWQRYHAE